MATLGDVLLIKLGLDAGDIEQQMSKVEENAKKSTTNVAQALDKTANNTANRMLGLVKSIAGPLAAAFSVGAMFKSYFGGLSQAAQMTGAYYKQLDEWREKMAVFNRYTKQDIEVYVKSQKALTNFRIAVADFSAVLMRSFNPILLKGVEALNSFSKWLSEHKEDAARFFKILAVVITTALVPAFISLAGAILMNPITWIIAGIVALALVIDDLIVRIKEGKSLFGPFWDPFIDFGKKAYDFITKFWSRFKESEGVNTFIETIKQSLSSLSTILEHVFNGIAYFGILLAKLFDQGNDTTWFDGLAQAAMFLVNAVGSAFNAILGVVEMIMGAIVALFTGDTELLKQGWSDFCSSFKNLFKPVTDWLMSIIDYVKQKFLGMFNSIVEKGKSMIDWVKDLNPFSDDDDKNEKKEVSKPTTYEGTDAPIVNDDTQPYSASTQGAQSNLPFATEEKKVTDTQNLKNVENIKNVENTKNNVLTTSENLKNVENTQNTDNVKNVKNVQEVQHSVQDDSVAKLNNELEKRNKLERSFRAELARQQKELAEINKLKKAGKYDEASKRLNTLHADQKTLAGFVQTANNLKSGITSIPAPEKTQQVVTNSNVSNHTTNSNSTSNQSKTVNNNITINGATPEMTRSVIQTANGLDNSYLAAQSVCYN
nr:MAG TPA: hypothetical protein [Caudoviricetes sp.]